VLDDLIERFGQLRASGLRKKPATDELVKWIDILQRRGIDPGQLDTPAMRSALLATFPVLVKNREDLERLKNL